jgi:hypothetical protein
VAAKTAPASRTATATARSRPSGTSERGGDAGSFGIEDGEIHVFVVGNACGALDPLARCAAHAAERLDGGDAGAVLETMLAMYSSPMRWQPRYRSSSR